MHAGEVVPHVLTKEALGQLVPGLLGAFVSDRSVLHHTIDDYAFWRTNAA